METLESHAKVDGDSTLVALVRTSSLFAHLHGTTDDEYLGTAANCQAILRRLEQEFMQLQPAGNQLIAGLGKILWKTIFASDTDAKSRRNPNANYVCRYIPRLRRLAPPTSL